MAWLDEATAQVTATLCDRNEHTRQFGSQFDMRLIESVLEHLGWLHAVALFVIRDRPCRGRNRSIYATVCQGGVFLCPCPSPAGTRRCGMVVHLRTGSLLACPV